MKKYIFLFIVLLSSTVSGQTLKNYFVSMPDSIVPLLTKINREDCIDFLESNMKAEVKNRFGKVSELKKMTERYLFLQVTPNSYVEMRLLNVNDSTQIIGVAKSYKAKAFDSSLTFFSTDWKKLDLNEYISFPERSGIAVNDTIDSVSQEIKDIMNLPLMKISFQDDSDDLIMEYTAPDTLDKELLKGVTVPDKIIKRYLWKDGQYVMMPKS